MSDMIFKILILGVVLFLASYAISQSTDIEEYMSSHHCEDGYVLNHSYNDKFEYFCVKLPMKD